MTPGEFWVGALAVVLVGFSKAGFGGGTGILATPLMVLAVGPKPALGILLPLLILCDWGTCLIHRKHWEWQPVLRLLPACGVGIVVGFLLIDSLDGTWLKRLLGVICISFCLIRWLGGRFSGVTVPGWQRGRAAVLGLMTGSASTLAHAAGPVVAMYLLPLGLKPRTFVATSVLAFTLINMFKFPGYWAMGLVDFSSLHHSAHFLVFIPIGILLGVWALNHLSKMMFSRIIYGIVFLTGLELVSGRSLLGLLLGGG